MHNFKTKFVFQLHLVISLHTFYKVAAKFKQYCDLLTSNFQAKCHCIFLRK